MDSIQFALALEQFDVTVHQPHPPGYYLYVMLGRLARHFISDANTAFVAISILFTGACVVMLYLIGRDVFDEDTGLAAAVRETREETGLAELDFKWGTVFQETAPYNRGTKTARYYLAETRQAAQLAARLFQPGIHRDIGAHRCHTALQGDVLEEHSSEVHRRAVMGHPNEAHPATGAADTDGGVQGFARSHAFEHGFGQF